MATKEFNSTDAEHVESITMEAVFRSWDGTGAAGCTMRLTKDEPEFENVKKVLIMAAKAREERLARGLERRERAELARLKKKVNETAEDVGMRMEELPVCVRHRDGWCATAKKTLRYADSVKTVCCHYVIACWGLERRMPDCPECLKTLRGKNGL